MSEINYNAADLSKMKYVKVTYTGLDNKQHDIKTEAKFIGESSISVYFRSKLDFDIKYPQEVTVKFVTDGGLFIARSVLQEIKKSDNFVYLTIEPPAKMTKRQERKYYRINLNRACVLVATNKDDCYNVFVSKLVDVSAGGVLIHRLESMLNNEIVAVNPSDYKNYNIILFLDIDTVLKLSARYVRHEKTEESYRYAFEFTNTKQKDIDTISKYVTKEQVEQLRLQRKTDNNYYVLPHA